MLNNDLVPKVPPKSGAQIDEIARETLIGAFGHMQNAFLPAAMIKFIENGGLRKFDLEYGVRDLPFGEEGKYDHIKREIILSPFTYEELFEDGRRAKFTFAHELGHAILHGHVLTRDLGGRTRPLFKRSSIKPYCDPEWQADRFAGAFLMPTSLMLKCIREGWSDAQIARYFGVSLQAAQTRRGKLLKK